MKTVEDREQGSVFLAATALEEFWDCSKKIVFLGEWCLLYKRKSYWNTLQAEVVESPWSDYCALRDAHDYVTNLYERLLPVLAEGLSEIHGVSYSDRYWRILIGPWLHLFLTVTYDRFMTLKKAIDRYNNFATVGLSEDCFSIPHDTFNFVTSVLDDYYNLQLITQMLTAMGYDFPTKSLSKGNELAITEPCRRFGIRRVVKKSFRVLQRKLFHSNSSIILKNSYFPRCAELRLLIKTAGRVVKMANDVPTIKYGLIDKISRLKIGEWLPDACEFERVLKRIIPVHVPQCFIERFSVIGDVVEKVLTIRPKAIFSANDWHFDEVFKQWAAKSSEQGTLLLGVQHGGNYGSIALMPFENHEIAITDRYYTWGWNHPDYSSKVTPMPIVKLVGREILGANNLKKGILFVTTSFPRYLLQFPVTTGQFIQYMNWHIRFLDSLTSKAIADLRIRPHYADFGWNIVDRIKEHHPSIPIETWEVPFLKSLSECRFYVCDHLSTTFIEALAVNKPTVLFWDKENNELRADAKPVYDKLREVGVLYDTPEAAATAVSLIYDDVESWWNNPVRQEAIRYFCSRFARTSPNAVDKWADEFKRVVSEEN